MKIIITEYDASCEVNNIRVFENPEYEFDSSTNWIRIMNGKSTTFYNLRNAKSIEFIYDEE